MLVTMFFCVGVLLSSSFSGAALNRRFRLERLTQPSEVELVRRSRSVGAQTEPVVRAAWLVGMKGQSIASGACPICLEDTRALSTHAGHNGQRMPMGGLLIKQLCDCRCKYHVGCLMRVKRCPTCRKKHTQAFRGQLSRLAQLQKDALEACPQESAEASFFAEIELLRQDSEKLKILLSPVPSRASKSAPCTKRGVKRKRRKKGQPKVDLVELFKKDRDALFAPGNSTKKSKRLRQAQDLIDGMLEALAVIHAKQAGLAQE